MQSIQNWLTTYGIRSLWHFTDARNLPSIRCNGLLRLAETARRAIDIPAPGGNDWSHDADRKRGLDEYVHLCLIDNHPMEYFARKEGRIESTFFLRIDSKVVLTPGVKFAADVSNKSGVQLLDPAEAFETMDFDAVFKRTDWKDPKIKERRKIAAKYEVLVPADIPLNLILNLR